MFHNLDIHYALDIDAGKERTKFGQPRLDDYGCDDLSGHRDDLPQPVVTRAVVTARPVIAASLDLDAPATQEAPPINQIRQPDFYDDGYAVWIGDDAAVGMPTHLLARLERLADFAGWFARSGIRPEVHDITVVPHTGLMSHIGVCTSADPSIASAWRFVTDTILREPAQD